MEDKIVMYNEIIEVIKLLKAIYMAYQKERRQILAPLDHTVSPNEDDDRKRGLRLSKALVMEAWSMCRPNPGSRKPRIDVP